MKVFMTIAILMCVSISFAQSNNKNVQYEKKGDFVEAIYYHDNGIVAQQGTFNREGKVHGTWTSYDLQGKKTAIANYDNGEKVGKWFFWLEDSLKEVDYVDSKIISVNNWNNGAKVAIF